MSRVLAVVVVALLVAGVGCADGDDSSSGGSYDYALTVLAGRHATPTPAPGTWGALAYDEKHDICQEAGEMMGETVAALGRQRGPAESMFYDKCMACGGPTEVLAHADPDWVLTVECRTEHGSPKSVPEGQRRIWP